MIKMKNVVVVSACRSPVGKIPGELNAIGEIPLLAKVFQEAVTRAGLPVQIEEALTGASFPIEKDNLCRKAILYAGLSEMISCTTISKTCASSDEALAIAWHKIRNGAAGTILVGGIEKIGNSPYVLHFMKQNVKRMLNKQLPCRAEIEELIQDNDMAYMNEVLARKAGISRQAIDAHTYQSILKAETAYRNGCFAEETVPIPYTENGITRYIIGDEFPQVVRSKREIYEADPMFLKDGVLTRLNSAAIAECAVAMLLMEEDTARTIGLQPIGRIVSVLNTAVPNEERGSSMAKCTQSILERCGLAPFDVGLYSINDSFMIQSMLTVMEMGLDADRVNVDGGNIGLGYPIGATGLRMCTSLLYEMQRRQVSLGLHVIGAGANMAQAVVMQLDG